MLRETRGICRGDALVPQNLRKTGLRDYRSHFDNFKKNLTFMAFLAIFELFVKN